MAEEASSSPDAVRMRIYRRRRRNRMRCVVVQVGPTDIEGLIAKGFLSPKRREDIEAIQAAADGFLSYALARRVSDA